MGLSHSSKFCDLCLVVTVGIRDVSIRGIDGVQDFRINTFLEDSNLFHVSGAGICEHHVELSEVIVNTQLSLMEVFERFSSLLLEGFILEATSNACLEICPRSVIRRVDRCSPIDIFLDEFISILSSHVRKGDEDFGLLIGYLVTSEEDLKLAFKASIVFIGAIIGDGQVELDAVSGGWWVRGSCTSWSHSGIYHCIRWIGG
jgi:hypothetical protein